MLTNRKARFNYTVLNTIEAGMVLLGSEVKVLRKGMGDISTAHVIVNEDAVDLVNMYIPDYKQSHEKYDNRRSRRVLLRKKQIKSLLGKIKEKGVTIIPLSVYFVRGYAKVELGICTGKTKFDKRQTIKERDRRRYGD